MRAVAGSINRSTMNAIIFLPIFFVFTNAQNCRVASSFMPYLSCTANAEGLELVAQGLYSVAHLHKMLTSLGPEKVVALTIQFSPYMRDFDFIKLQGISALSELKNLAVRQVNFPVFPASVIRDYRKLRKLEISQTSFGSMSIPPSCCDSESLEGGLAVLNLTQNRISHLKPHNFEKLQTLVELDLSWNVISNLPDNAFTGLANLRYLKLQGNLVRNLPSNAFDGLDLLEVSGGDAVGIAKNSRGKSCCGLPNHQFLARCGNYRSCYCAPFYLLYSR